MAERFGVLWFPGWPVTAWALAEAEDDSAPVAVLVANRVTSCSTAALAEGVLPGQRRREAQSRCPQLRVIAADEARDARCFEPVVAAVERLAPGVQVIRPGLCALRLRGLASYLGSELEAAETLLEAVATEVGIISGRFGIADGLFAAIQAARAGDPVLRVLPGGSPDFLAPLPVARLGRPELAELLPRLGVRTLGEFAALPVPAVRERFGSDGLRLHTLAGGTDPQHLQPRTPPPELTATLSFEPPLEVIEQVAFSAKGTTEEFIGRLAAAGLALTEVRIELTSEVGEVIARHWLAATVFDAAAVIDRIRWQLQAASGGQLSSPLARLRLEPLTTDEAAHHVPGLFGLGPDERVHHVLSRVQSLVGPDQVVTVRLSGGRWLAERQQLVAWGDRPVATARREEPWPGMVPDPLPGSVFIEPKPVRLLTSSGRPVRVDDRGRVTDPPVALGVGQRTLPVIGWAGPWPVSERAWDPQRARRADRFQVVDGEGTGWLLFTDADGCWAEARYD